VTAQAGEQPIAQQEQAAPQQMASAKDARKKRSTAGVTGLTFEETVPIAADTPENYGGAVIVAGMEAQPVVVGSLGFVGAALAVASIRGDTNGSP
jgi:hypothetical protein